MFIRSKLFQMTALIAVLLFSCSAFAGRDFPFPIKVTNQDTSTIGKKTNLPTIKFTAISDNSSLTGATVGTAIPLTFFNTSDIVFNSPFVLSSTYNALFTLTTAGKSPKTCNVNLAAKTTNTGLLTYSYSITPTPSSCGKIGIALNIVNHQLTVIFNTSTNG